MPPKTATAAKQGSKKTEKKQQVQLDDFFTRFLYKKKRALNKKLQKIETLEQTPAAQLNEQQKETLATKKESLDKLNYFDKIQEMYYEAYTTKDDVDEDGPAPTPSKTEKAAPEKSESPATKQVDEKDIHKKNARSFAELVSVSSYFHHPQNKEAWSKAHGKDLLKKFGGNFLDSVNSLWRSVTDTLEVENRERVEEIAKIVENYLSGSETLSSAANQTYQKLQEGVKALASDEGFRLSKHVAPPIAEVKAHLPHHVEAEPARKGSEVKMVKNSKPASRKVSNQVVAQDDEQEEEIKQSPEQKKAEPRQDFTKKPAKEIDPDEPQNTDDGWIPVSGNAGAQGRGRGGRGGRGARGGRGGPRDGRPDTRGEKGEGRNFRRERDEDDKRPQGEEGDREERGERRERRGGRGKEGEPRQYDGERRQYDGERRQYNGERRERKEGETRQYDGERRERREGEGRQYDGERRERREGESRQYDGERRERRGGYRGGDRGDGQRRPRGGDRPEGDRRPREDRPKDQGAEGARTDSTK